MGTRNVLEAASEQGSKVVLASTSEVYGRNPKVPWREDDDRVLGSTTVDRWSYSTSKATCEHLALAVHHGRGMPLTIVRYFNVYGPRQSPIYVISRAIQRILTGKPPLLYDGGEQTRCFTYVDDVVDGTIRAALSDQANGEVFNLGSMNERTVKEATELVLSYSGTSLEWEEFRTDEQFGAGYQDISRRVPDTAKARAVLGWSASTELGEGIRRTIEWARDHPDWLDAHAATTPSIPITTEGDS
jgi:UDP-glucose 4-epimerase